MRSNSSRWRAIRPATRERPLLVAVGGFAGAGKTTLSRRWSAGLGIPRLGSDYLIRIVSRSRALADRPDDVPWIAYDVFFGLAEEILRTGLAVIVDPNMGEAWRRRHLDAIRDRNPTIVFVPIVLRLPIETRVARMRGRHADDPRNESVAEPIMAERRPVRKWEVCRVAGPSGRPFRGRESTTGRDLRGGPALSLDAPGGPAAG